MHRELTGESHPTMELNRLSGTELRYVTGLCPHNLGGCFFGLITQTASCVGNRRAGRIKHSPRSASQIGAERKLRNRFRLSPGLMPGSSNTRQFLFQELSYIR